MWLGQLGRMGCFFAVAADPMTDGPIDLKLAQQYFEEARSVNVIARRN